MRLISKLVAGFKAWRRRKSSTAAEILKAKVEAKATKLGMSFDLEQNRAALLLRLRRYPLEIESPIGSPVYYRACIDTEADLDKLIQQLRADHVLPEEALNPTLVC